MQRKVEPGMSHVIPAGEGKRFDVLGAHLIWKARGEDTDGTFTVAVQTLAPSEHIPPHKHQYPEVFFVTSGELIFTLTRGCGGSRRESQSRRYGDCGGKLIPQRQK